MDIDLYIDFVYHGFYTLDYIEERFDEYHAAAQEAAKGLADDEVILYAIYAFDENSQRFLYANFMTMKLKLEQYTKACEKLSKHCRLFCIRNG